MIRIVRWSVSTETTKQLTKETRTPVPMKKGQPARVDYEYEPNGTANMFMMFAPLERWRHVKVTERRTAIDYAHALKELADVHFPGARKIVLVQDNLNTHAASNGTTPPKHGSWLDLAESELGVLASQCLDRCIPDHQTLVTEVAASQHDRNHHDAKTDWHFTTEKARVKLKHLYPSL
jgi:hypothetical protein